MLIPMVDRISLLLKAKNISASQFADEISVQRSSISHVLSGRNKPSLEFVQKILKRYPEINPDWLLFGKGPMNMEFNLFSEVSESIPVKEEAIHNALKKQEQLIRPVPEPEDIKVVEPAVSAEPVIKEAQPQTAQSATIARPIQAPESQTAKPGEPLNEPAPQPVQDKTIEKVLVFFNNKTFREYSPE
jgi:transcriptional regulator with XRE-family HTH domain